MSGIDLSFRVEDAKLIAGLLRVIGKQKEFTTEVDKSKKASAQAEAELNKFVSSIKKIDAKPTEIFRQQMDLLNKALKAGKIQQEEFDRTAKRLLQTQQAADPFYQQQIKTEKERKRAAEETATALQAQADAAKKLADQLAQQSQKRADSIIEQDRTALERYKTSFAELKALREKGLLTQEQFNRALAREKGEFQATDPLLKQRAAALKNAEAAQLAMTRANERMSASSRSTFAEMASAMGMVTNIGGGVSMIINQITQAIAESNEKLREAKRLMDDLEDPLIDLNQVSDSPAQFQQRQQRAATAAGREGVSVKAAQRVLLDAIGAGAEDDFETILSSRRGVMKPEDAGLVVSKMTGLFKGKITGTEAIDLVLAASASEGTKDTVKDLAQGIPKAALGGSQLGASPAETAATLTAMSDAFGGNAAMAGDRMQAFGVKMKLAGKQGSFVDVMAQIRSLPADQRAELLGNDQEINIAYDLIDKNEQLIRARSAEAQQALDDSRAGRGMSQQKKAQWAADPQTAALQMAAEAKAQRDVALMGAQGIPGQQRAAILNDIERDLLPRTRFQQFAGNKAAQVAQGAVPDQALPGVAAAGASAFTWKSWVGGVAAGPFAPLVYAGNALYEAAKKMDQAAAKNKHRAMNLEAAQPLN